MKHKSKTINGTVYSTKKSDLIKEYTHTTNSESSSYVKFLYRTKDNKYFVRIIDFMSDRIEECTESNALNFVNTFKSLF